MLEAIVLKGDQNTVHVLTENPAELTRFVTFKVNFIITFKKFMNYFLLGLKDFMGAGI